MEKTTAKSSKSKVDHSRKIRDAYISYVLEHGSPPSSVFKFVKGINIKEGVFYEYFSSFEHIEQEIWLSFLERTIDSITAEEVYGQYSAREKLLAFYYTLIEVMKSNRSYILQTVPGPVKPELTPYYLKLFRRGFKDFVNGILTEARETDEVKERRYISNKYDEGLWVQLLFVLKFWIRDTSKGFEKTDAAIEKAVNLAFDLMGKGPLDTMVDFAKFLYQNR